MAQEVRRFLFGGHDPYAELAVIPFNNHGWAGDVPIFQKYIEEIKPKLIYEVGTWFGQSSRNIASSCVRAGIEDFELVCIDTFLGSFEHWNKTSYLMTFKNGRPIVYDQFLSNVVHTGLQNFITPLPCDSINAYELLKTTPFKPDMIYIDAGHDYYSVKNDLVNWSSLLREGGILIGDDFHHPPIIEAVTEVFGDKAVGDMGKFIWRK